MKFIEKLLIIACSGILISACTHSIEKDYPAYLAKNKGNSSFEKTDKVHLYYIAPHAENFKYEFRAFATGVANLWVVEFGKMLDDTLKSADVQAAFGGITKVDNEGQNSAVILFDVNDYTFKDYGAHVKLHVAVKSSGNLVFEKDYESNGKEQVGKMISAGAFGQKNAVQQSTKSAIDEILKQVILDLHAHQ
jgi:hypothetical protein